MVYGFSPEGYSKASVVTNDPRKAEGTSVFRPRSGEVGYLVFQGIKGSPAAVDMVCIYRPEAEHESILQNHVLPFGAKTIWLQPPVTSSALQQLTAASEIKIMEGVDIALIAAKI